MTLTDIMTLSLPFEDDMKSAAPSMTRVVQWEIPVPSLLCGFKLFPPGNLPYGNSQEISEIWEFPELWEFPALWEFWEFLSHGKFPFSKCTYIGFSIGFLHWKACLMRFFIINIIYFI